LSVDPWEEQIEELATSVEQFEMSGDDLWTLEAGQLIVRRQGRIEARIGADVTEIHPGPGGSGWGVFVDAGNLFQVEVGEEPELVREDVCDVAHVGGSDERILRYFSPCATRRLVADSLRLFEDDEVFEEDVMAIRTFEVSVRGSYIFQFWVGNPGDEAGTLFYRRAGLAPVEVGPDAPLWMDDVLEASNWAVIDWNGESGSLVPLWDWPFEPVAHGFAEQNSLGILSDFDGTTGTLHAVRNNELADELGRHVPPRATRGRAFVADSQDGIVGDLFVVEEGARRFIAHDVEREAFSFSENLSSVLIYLDEFDVRTGAGKLHALLLDSGDRLRLSNDVGAYVEMGLPKPGVLYRVERGSRQGLWFAGAR
jgi:hypothetical protein